MKRIVRYFGNVPGDHYGIHQRVIQCGLYLAGLAHDLGTGYTGYRDLRIGSRRTFQVSYGISILIHLSVIILLGGAESTGRNAGPLFASRASPPIQVRLSSESLVTENVPPQPLPEPDRVLEKVPEHQSTKAEPSSSPETAKGDRQFLVGPLSEMQYLSARELDARPIAQMDLETDFPGLDKFPHGGGIVLMVWVNEFGTVDGVSVEHSDFPKEILGPVLERLKTMKFIPAEKDGRLVRARMKLLLDYPSAASLHSRKSKSP